MMRKNERPTASKYAEEASGPARGPRTMNRQEQIAREVERTLDLSLRPTPFATRSDFQARLQARIREGRTARRPFLALFLQPRLLVPAALALLLTINVITAFFVLRKSATGTDTRSRGLAVLAEEYDLKATAVSSYWK
jgi:hypothetical protein